MKTEKKQVPLSLSSRGLLRKITLSSPVVHTLVSAIAPACVSYVYMEVHTRIRSLTESEGCSVCIMGVCVCLRVSVLLGVCARAFFAAY